MDPTPPISVNASTPSPKTDYRKLLVLFILFVIIIVLGVGVFINESQKSDVQENNKHISGIQIAEQISPWSHAQNPLQNVPTPSLQDLNKIYRDVRDAVKKRDYQKFKTLVSSERIWNIENPKKLVGEETGGEFVFELMDKKTESDFVRFAPTVVYFDSPEVDQIVPTHVEAVVTEQEPVTVILLDKVFNKATRLYETVWKYSYELKYNIDSQLDKGEGSVVFVWDNGWKYNGEAWNISWHQTPVTKGEIAIPNHEISTSEYGCSPPSLTIRAGETVSFKNITGKVYSVSPQSDYWDSGFLHFDNFVKTFPQPGNYVYLIQDPATKTEDVEECILVVK